MLSQSERCPYYSRVPKGYADNLRWRRRCLELGYSDPEYARQLWILCSRDILFWINTFGYTYDPRKKGSTVIPFNTYAYQDEAILELVDCVEHGIDILIEKSRTMGVTWMVLVVMEWFWQFRRYQSFRLVSRVEDLVDKTEDPDCLFWKIDFFVKHQPMWLSPRESLGQTHRTHLHIKNLLSESMLDGSSTTGDVARGGRCRAMLLDEFAAVPNDQDVLSSVRDVTNCRIFVSTHKGTATAFYRLTKTPMRKLRLHWTLHPMMRAGLYQWDKETDRVKLLDDFVGPVKDNTGRVYQFPDLYPFRRDGKVRSPLYDVQCDRASHPMEIAQELDIDPFASDAMFFEETVIAHIKATYCREPLLRGYLEYDPDTLEPIEFVEQENGPLCLWFRLNADGGVPRSLIVGGGVDISAGTGASNSVSAWGNMITHEKIAEYVNPWIKPEEFARLTVAMARWLNEAYLIWDGGGPGGTFGDVIVESGYRNFYYQRAEDRLFKKGTDKPGMFLNPAPKLRLLGAYRKSLKDETFIQRSHTAIEECREYVFTNRNTVEHSAEYQNIDPSGAKASHGDRVIGDALLNKAYDVVDASPAVESKEDSEYCFAARSAKRHRRLKQAESDMNCW
jgi:hypothetical protein